MSLTLQSCLSLRSMAKSIRRQTSSGRCSAVQFTKEKHSANADVLLAFLFFSIDMWNSPSSLSGYNIRYSPFLLLIGIWVRINWRFLQLAFLTNCQELQNCEYTFNVCLKCMRMFRWLHPVAFITLIIRNWYKHRDKHSRWSTDSQSSTHSQESTVSLQSTNFQ